ncbi:MAG: hypothetical protein MJ237_06240 [bacterium]|nr:hypothetical protein [bacterium]
MIYTLNFFKQDNKWYADVPGHTLEDNEMVFGSDTLLDGLSCNGDKLSIKFSDEPIETYVIHAHMIEHDDDGATYLIMTNDGMDVSMLQQQFWICNVTHDVCGEHPNDIYIINFS